MIIKVAILILFVIVMVGIGFYCRKFTKNVGEFVLGDRNVGAWLTAFAYGTTYFSAVIFVGYAGQFGYKFGIAATWIGIGNALIGSLLAWKVLGKKTSIMTKHFKSTTMPEFFESRYNSKALKIVSSAIIFVFLIPYSASVYKGLFGLFSTAFGIGPESFQYVVIAMALLTAIYVILGGYLATAINDFVQGIIMLIGIVVVVITVLNGKGGFTNAISALSQTKEGALQGAFVSFFGPDLPALIGVIILTSLGVWGMPQMIHKFYAIKDEKAIQRGTIISTVFAMIIAGGAYFMGAFGKLYYTVPADGKVVFDNIVPTMLNKIPDLLLGIVIILVLSASMSTLSSLVMTSSSTLTLDFIKGIFAKNMNMKKQVLVIRILIAVFILFSVLLALDTNPKNIITALMSWSWGAIAGSFLGPFIYGLYWKGVTKAGVWAGYISGVGITLIGFFIFLTEKNATIFSGSLAIFNSPINIGAFSILISLIIVPIVSLLTPKLSKKHIEDTFSCYQEKPVK